MSASTQSLRSLVFATYKRALKAGALTFSETEVHNIAHDGINYQIRYAPNLLKKPTPAASQSHNASLPAPPKANPFLPPNPALYIAPLQSSHYLVLNKFPVIPGHFILATTGFEKQGCPLTTGDLEAALSVLRDWESDISHQTDEQEEQGEYKSLYGFFNSGKASGASQPHRHLQFIPLTRLEVDGLWAKQMFDSNPSENGVVEGKVGDLKIRYQSKVMYKHYFVRINDDCKPEELWKMYTTLLSLAEYSLSHPATPADAVLKEADERWDSISTTQRLMDVDVPFSYNMAFTKGWMGILPRTTETVYVVDKEENSGAVVDGVAIKCPGLNLNGTALAGMTLIRTRKEMDVVLADPGCIARTVGGIGVSQQETHRASL
ncbi:bifunctional AP-4-A phosphorylase/ADP sulfurylase [Orbilia javanica]|uniref:Bifunctional AP-4-A phosphorylase/ADP sulfurylase n=1 Tax=Orbilia javanica TaxID=47235 RepID=A0AAN8MJU9_9PEZI